MDILAYLLVAGWILLELVVWWFTIKESIKGIFD